MIGILSAIVAGSLSECLIADKGDSNEQDSNKY